ncbi:hypothetical protein LCGC14_3038790 [marine sediment metagenome]|uniref:Uncharacterized protein n=1 Tax=marine sediment metagenome TaxID=412755 RepID=A0A0F8WQT0_9ZZZZ
MEPGLGRAGRFYELTPKADEFITALRAWAAEREIPEDQIGALLEAAARQKPSGQNPFEVIKSLVEKGFLEEKKDG